MAQRFFQQFSFGLEKMPVRLQLRATGKGGTGAITIVRGKGITSVSESGTGLWTITLDDVYYKLLSANVEFLANDGSTAPNVANNWIKSETVATTKTVVIQLTNNSGTATSPSTTTDVFVELVLSNSTAV